MSSELHLQAGGTLGEGALYIERPVDAELCTALEQRQYCYVLAPRQIGKSSLRVRTARILRSRGILTVSIDLTATGGTATSEDAWYFDLTNATARALDLGDPSSFWTQHAAGSPLGRFVQYLCDVVLVERTAPIVLFIDEIETVRTLSAVSGDDFFVAIRAIYNLRAEDPAWERLTFCLLGVAQPADLISDEARTPFNIGQRIELIDFSRAEMSAFAPALAEAGGDPEALLDAVYEWTAGNPYMTQKLCDALVEEGPGGEGTPAERVVRLVEQHFLRRGRVLEPSLSYAERWFDKVSREPLTDQMLRLYRALLGGTLIVADGGDRVQMALRLTGLAGERRRGERVLLEVRNRIVAMVFDAAWVKQQEAERLFAVPLERWLAAGRSNDLVLRGEELRAAREWAEGREDVSPEERAFLTASEVAAERTHATEQLVQTRRRTIAILSGALGLVALVAAGALWQYLRAEAAAMRERELDRAAREQATDQVRLEKSQRAKLEVEQPGSHVDTALVAGLESVGETIAEHRTPPAEMSEGLIAAASRTVPSQILSGHVDQVEAVAYSPDGARIVTTSKDKMARLWDAQTGRLLVTLSGHSGWVNAVAYSPDGAHLVTASSDKTARVWDAHDGHLLTTLSGHIGPVWAIAYSPDGANIVTASSDKTARMWHVRDGRLLATLPGHLDELRAVAYSPDGSRIVTASSDKTARLWDARDGHLLAILSGHTRSVNAVAYSPDGTRLVTASIDDTACLWDIHSGHLLATLSGHTRSVSAIAYSPDGTRLVTASWDKTARLWDARSGRLIATFSGHTDDLQAVAYSPNGACIITASSDKTARLWDAHAGRLIATLTGHTEPVSAIAYSPDGSRIVTASSDKTARLWDVHTGRLPVTLCGHADAVNAIAYSPDGARIVTASSDQTVRLWDARAGRLLTTLSDHVGPLVAVTYSPDGGRIVAASWRKTARLWDARAGRLLAILPCTIDILDEVEVFTTINSPYGTRIETISSSKASVRDAYDQLLVPWFGHLGPALAVAYSPDGARIVTAGLGKACLWGADDGRLLATLSSHTGQVRAVAYSSDGTSIVTAGNDRTARLWDAHDGRLLATLSGHTGQVEAVTYSPDGARIATASDDKTARLWDVHDGHLLATLSGHTGQVKAVVYSPAGDRIATASDDKTARLWNAHDGRLLATLSGHTGQVRGVAYSPNGDRIVTTSDDKMARLWDAHDGRALLILSAHAAPVAAVAYSPDGSHVATADTDGTVLIQPTQLEPWFAFGCRMIRQNPLIEGVSDDRRAHVLRLCAGH